jgi:hypothetical protein
MRNAKMARRIRFYQLAVFAGTALFGSRALAQSLFTWDHSFIAGTSEDWFNGWNWDYSYEYEPGGVRIVCPAAETRSL